MQTWAIRKDRNPIHLTENLNWTLNLSKIRRIWEPWFYIYGGTTLWTVALKRPIFKRKKGFANLSLGLIYHSKALPQPPSRDIVPLRLQYVTHYKKRHLCPISNNVQVLFSNSACRAQGTVLYVTYHKQDICSPFQLLYLFLFYKSVCRAQDTVYVSQYKTSLSHLHPCLSPFF
jgi:hypothetical protein